MASKRKLSTIAWRSHWRCSRQDARRRCPPRLRAAGAHPTALRLHWPLRPSRSSRQSHRPASRDALGSERKRHQCLADNGIGTVQNTGNRCD